MRGLPAKPAGAIRRGEQRILLLDLRADVALDTGATTFLKTAVGSSVRRSCLDCTPEVRRDS